MVVDTDRFSELFLLSQYSRNPLSKSRSTSHLSCVKLQYNRGRQRPRSCKYDSYRLRSRTSVVDESLFGEPLKNKLIMARSKSMEVISQPGGREE